MEVIHNIANAGKVKKFKERKFYEEIFINAGTYFRIGVVYAERNNTAK